MVVDENTLKTVCLEELPVNSSTQLPEVHLHEELEDKLHFQCALFISNHSVINANSFNQSPELTTLTETVPTSSSISSSISSSFNSSEQPLSLLHTSNYSVITLKSYNQFPEQADWERLIRFCSRGKSPGGLSIMALEPMADCHAPDTHSEPLTEQNLPKHLLLKIICKQQRQEPTFIKEIEEFGKLQTTVALEIVINNNMGCDNFFTPQQHLFRLVGRPPGTFIFLGSIKSDCTFCQRECGVDRLKLVVEADSDTSKSVLDVVEVTHRDTNKMFGSS